MDWINALERPPTKEDSPILAWGEDYQDYMDCAALEWDSGWYDKSGEYSMKQNRIRWWMPLPQPPKE